MLSAPLATAYQKYKEDTNAVASWLACTAKSCGYPADLLPGGASQTTGPERSKRLKGTARKEAKAAASQQEGISPDFSRPRHIIAIKDFIPLAEFVAASRKPVISVPRVFTNTLNRVISMRSDFSSQLAATGSSPSATDDSKHSYFVGVLEKVREVLKPRFAPDSQDAACRRSPSDTMGEVGGRFAGLSVYEPSEEFLHAPDVERPMPVKNDNSTYAAEPLQDFEEVMFAYNLLIDDLYLIRDRINSIWMDYRDNNFDPVAAAIATNTACDLARNLMEEMAPTFKAHGGGFQVGKKFFSHQCLKEGFSWDEITIFGDDFNYDTYEIARATYMIPYIMLDLFLELSGPPDLIPFPDSPDTYDPARDWDRMSMKEKYEQDKILLLESFTDLLIIVRHVESYPVHDEFIRGMQELDRAREAPMYLAFAAQVFLDIHHVLRGRVYSAQETCMSHMRLIDEDLALQLEFHAKHGANKNRDATQNKLTKLRKLIKWVQDDQIHQLTANTFSDSGMPLTVPKHRMLRYSPVISGLTLYYVRATHYRYSLLLADDLGFVVNSLHLYNALQHEKLLTPSHNSAESWSDMSLAVTILGNESFYVGSELPGKTEDYLKKLRLRAGVPPIAFSKRKDVRPQTLANLSKGRARHIKFDCAPVSDMFVKRYIFNTGQDWTPEHVDRVVSRSLHECVDVGQPGFLRFGQIRDPDRLRERKREIATEAARKKKTPAAGAPMAVDELITDLFFALQAESPTMVFPYLELHRACCEVLEKVQDVCEPLIVDIFGSQSLEVNSKQTWMVTLIFMALSMGFKGPFVKAGEAVKDQLRRGEGTRAIRRLHDFGFNALPEDPGVGTLLP